MGRSDIERRLHIVNAPETALRREEFGEEVENRILGDSGEEVRRVLWRPRCVILNATMLGSNNGSRARPWEEPARLGDKSLRAEDVGDFRFSTVRKLLHIVVGRYLVCIYLLIWLELLKDVNYELRNRD
jgi:hypothetical protein